MVQDLFGRHDETTRLDCPRSQGEEPDRRSNPHADRRHQPRELTCRRLHAQRRPLNQNNPETYALTTRFPLEDAARFRALARSRGVTPSALAAKLIHEAVTSVSPSQNDLNWAAHRRSKNSLRRQLQDERTHRGDYRKPGWENLPARTTPKTH